MTIFAAASRLPRGWEAGGTLELHPPEQPNPVSQNHRMVGVGRDFCGSSSPTPLPKQGPAWDCRHWRHGQSPGGTRSTGLLTATARPQCLPHCGMQIGFVQPSFAWRSGQGSGCEQAMPPALALAACGTSGQVCLLHPKGIFFSLKTEVYSS